MHVFVVAGEASGDRLGAAAMAGLRALIRDVEFSGVGGPLMQAEGLNSLFPMDELSVMGIAEVLPKYRQLRARMIQTANVVLAARPDVLLTIDSPDFCLRVAARVRSVSRIRTVHYVAPSVWAWRPGRAGKMARHVDQVLALLPFEPPFMEAAGMRCDFVGHPVVAEPCATPAQIAAFRVKHQLDDGPALLMLPGSRNGELTRLCPIFGTTLAHLTKLHPKLKVILPTLPHLTAKVRTLTADWPVAPIILEQSGANAQQDKRAAFAAADVALAASGTVSLELAAAGTPMVVAYDMNWISWQIMSRMALIDTVTLVNLVTDTRVVPEFLGPACQPPKIAQALRDVMDNPDRQKLALSQTMIALGKGNQPPGERAAQAILDGLEQD